MSSERISRPPLARREPVRAWSGTVERWNGTGAADVVSRAVDLGYRVVDEYLRQGQRAAEQLGVRPLMGSPWAGPFAPDVQDVATRMAQYTSDAFALWLQFVDAALGMNGARTAPAPPVPNGWHSVASAPSTEAVRVRLDVRARRRVEVTVDIAPDAAGRPATVQALRAVDPSKRHLTEVRLAPGGPDAPPTLVVYVPDDQPADLYSGIVVDDATGRLAGTVTIRVRDDDP